MRTAFRFFVAAQSLAFAALIVVAAVSLTRDLAQVPAAIAGASLALGLFSVFPVRARALGVEAVYAWIARTPLARDGVASHRPFQFAAALAALGSSAAVRLPGFVADAGPRVLARFETDMATDGPLKTLWVWGIATLIVGGLVLLVVLFSILVIWTALTPSAAPMPRADAARMSLLWNFLATGVFATAELPGLFDDAPPITDVQFWLALVIALALARRVLVLSVLHANDRLGLGLDDTLAARALPVQVPRRLTALALALACAVQLALDHALGVAFAASAIVVGSEPLVLILERTLRAAEPRRSAVDAPAASGEHPRR